MTLRSLGVSLASAALVLGAATGCGGGGNDAGVDVQGTDGSIADCGEAGYSQTTGTTNSFVAQSCSGSPFCPAQVVNSQTTPMFVLTQIDVSTPAALHGPPVGTILNQAIANGLFFWGISLDFTAMTLRTGALQGGVTAMPNLGFFDDTFQYYAGNATTPDGGVGSATRWDPIMSTVTLAGEAFTSGTIDLITVPVFGVDMTTMTTGLLAELPLRQTTIAGATMTAGRECIGLAHANFNSGNINQWATQSSASMPYATIAGDITVADARTINVQISAGISETLCSLLAGLGGAGADGGATNCENTPMASWPNQPSGMVGGMPSYHLVASFAAVAATIH